MLDEQVGHMLQQDETRNAFVAGISVGKVFPDVPQGCRAEQGVTDRMEQDVRIGVTFEPQMKGYFHTAENELSVSHQTVDVVSESNTCDGLDGVTLSRSEYNGPLSA